MKVAGLDPSLRNWGWSKGVYVPETGLLSVDTAGVIQPVVPTGKQVRVNSSDLVSAEQLMAGTWEAIQDCDAVFVEVPVGSQSARAMASYGICVGVLGSLRARGIPIIEMTPLEIKAVTGKKAATKKEMIEWATTQHPEVAWPRQTKNGVTSIVEGKAEHMADSIAAIHAGVMSQYFQQLVRMHKGKS